MHTTVAGIRQYAAAGPLDVPATVELPESADVRAPPNAFKNKRLSAAEKERLRHRDEELAREAMAAAEVGGSQVSRSGKRRRGPGEVLAGEHGPNGDESSGDDRHARKRHKCGVCGTSGHHANTCRQRG